ncbi:S9 family peptidase [Sphingobacterium psychroaquaticum]|uniref:Dipeptidyl aminopeptidase/acylaminoacyl peptidase n=1 Tax=Sphingobacterium psychroaquaticum TaxID=561061 RepID=A0A1X7IJR4_9SPHI|nr:DPP IV N-terminal domain-containing protein [Sphingobacterium psychroaquaticum]SMG14987.1 Dipeptidyl aminopeptidase/acylaminoacyl peptidase [Sphingobacterium psychroaquaticum]
MRKLLSLLLLGASLGSMAQTEQPTVKANYNLAAKFSPSKLRTMIFTTEVKPNWINHSDRFWYEYQTSTGKKWYVVDPLAKSRYVLFDNADMAAQVTRIVKNPFDAQHLAVENLKFTDDEKHVRFEVRSTKDTVKSKDELAKLKNKADSIKKKTYFLEYTIATKQLREIADTLKEKDKPYWASVSPDTNKVFFAKNYNIYWMDRANLEKAIKDDKDSTIVEHQVTKDGMQYYAWGGDQYSVTTGNDKDEDESKKRQPVRLSWSPDGKYFALTRKDNRHLNPLWVINNVGQKRPTLETYKYLVPGETDSTEAELYIFNAANFNAKQVSIGAFKNQTVAIYGKDQDKSSYKGKHFISYWLGDNQEFYVTRGSRDLKRIDIVAVSINGDVRTVVEERSNVYQDIKKPYFVNNESQFIHWSQRDGWGHFYLYSKEGKLVRQLTNGEFNCEAITGYDKATQQFTFTANAKELNEDPYYLHHYSLSINGGQPKLLNKGNFDHQVEVSESGKYFVNNYSRVNTAPKSDLYSASGQLIMKLEEADLSQLFAAGYKFPEPFKVKAGDGITDLYGVMYKPFDFDSTRVYPIVEYVYPGPQTEAVNKSFGRSMDRIDRLAQMGFVVITVGNRGGHPSRSKWYHTYGYGNLRDYGLEDKKVAAEQLANRYSFLDVNRVGITGHSGGGFMSTAAMLVYPDFFKVAVSGAGNHENNIYNRWWSERHHGVVEKVSAKGDTTFSYQIDKNTELAKNLKGKLLIATGDIDNNVHPANSIRMVDALIKANKRFDFLLLPGQRHAFGNMTEYFFWKMADYFSEHLLGDSKYNDVDMTEINRETPLKR